MFAPVQCMKTMAINQRKFPVAGERFIKNVFILAANPYQVLN